jgi:hypothetical protein
MKNHGPVPASAVLLTPFHAGRGRTQTFGCWVLADRRAPNPCERCPGLNSRLPAVSQIVSSAPAALFPFESHLFGCSRAPLAPPPSERGLVCSVGSSAPSETAGGGLDFIRRSREWPKRLSHGFDGFAAVQYHRRNIAGGECGKSRGANACIHRV